MKTILKSAALLALLALPAFADTTKEDVKKLAAAKMSDDLIIAFIRANGPAARLSADDLVDLKQSGVSDAVMKALVAPPAAASSSGAAPALAPSSSQSQSDADALKILNRYTPPVQQEAVYNTTYVSPETTYYAPAVTRVYSAPYYYPSYSYYPYYSSCYSGYYYPRTCLGYSWSSSHHHHHVGHWGFRIRW